MKMHRKRQLRLRDVIKIVSRYADNDQELSLAVADLINRGRIKLQGRYHNCKVVVA